MLLPRDNKIRPTPVSSPPHKTNLRVPNLSASQPTNGAAMPDWARAKLKTRDIAVALSTSSLRIGRKNTVNPLLVRPELTAPIVEEARTIHQP